MAISKYSTLFYIHNLHINTIKLIKIDANLYLRMTNIERELQGKNYKVEKNDNYKTLFLLINKKSNRLQVIFLKRNN